MNIEEPLVNLEKQKAAFQMLADGYRMLSELPQDNPHCEISQGDFLDSSVNFGKKVKLTELLIHLNKEEIDDDEFINKALEL